MSFLSMIKKLIRRRIEFLYPSFEKRIAPLAARQAKDIVDLHGSRKSGKALFIDMGSNLGQGFNFFSRYYNPDIFDYRLIEANPFCIDQLKSNVSKLYKEHSWNGSWEIINAAISNKNGILKLYGLVEDKRGKVSDGASVVKDHNSAFYESNENKALEVKSIKASDFIKEASQKYSTIAVKMDIEASEYDALEDLINSGYIDKIDHIYVEWHSRYFSDKKVGDLIIREKQIKARLAGKQTDWH
ncbi:MAG: FkbM family methyltransferase [Deltaproteobacteria bacterium]|nr:FkbM family methyltransferase [Deltaproteobacteria bacterium]